MVEDSKKYFDGFIAEQLSRGVGVTSELLEVNAELKIRDMAKERYENRPLMCRLGLHSRVQAWYGGGYPLTCLICWRHKL